MNEHEIHRNGRMGYQVDIEALRRNYPPGTCHESKLYSPEGLLQESHLSRPSEASELLKLSVAFSLPIGILGGLALLAVWVSKPAPPVQVTEVKRVEVNARCEVRRGFWVQEVQCPVIHTP
ncbi:hypothetical protein [Leptolyngbya sp. FACHB-261]|uniref:hypothetical protein n=1 Tax=Leptolyngbya sp. FACHB-261 TaxID=2692806 RepID=UPI001689B36A|nr:hypothetical protein [Leptolyngbya sp. FACHB-261]MBD2102170.1 hypothetical protein [Leptolyngbya sp. FACHB-261]